MCKVNTAVQWFAGNGGVSTFPIWPLQGSGSKVLSLSVDSLKWLCEFSGINGVQSNWCYSLVPEKGKISVCFYGGLMCLCVNVTNIKYLCITC